MAWALVREEQQVTRVFHFYSRINIGQRVSGVESELSKLHTGIDKLHKSQKAQLVHNYPLIVVDLFQEQEEKLKGELANKDALVSDFQAKISTIKDVHNPCSLNANSFAGKVKD